MPIIELPDGREVEFPDNMSQEQMSQAIQQNFPEFAQQQQQQPEPNQLQKLGNLAGGFNQLVESTGLPGLSRGLGQSALNTLFGVTGSKAPKITQGDSFSESAGQFAGDVAQFVAAPELSGAQKLSFLPRLLANMGFGGALSAAQAKGRGATTGEAAKEGLVGSLFGGAGELFSTAVNKILNRYPNKLREASQRAGSMVSTPEEAGQFLQELENRGIDLNMDVGSLAQDPKAVDFYYKFLGRFAPGAKKEIQTRAEAYNKLFEDTYRSMQNGQTAAEARKTFANGLAKHYDEASKINSGNYAKLAEEADKAGVQVNEFNNVDSVINSFEDVDVPKDLQKIMQRITARGTTDPATGQTSGLSFKEINKNIKDLNQKIKWGAKVSPENDLRKAFVGALKKDLEVGVEASGNPELNQLRQQANNYYKNNLAVLRDEPALYRVAKGNSDDIKDLDSILRNRGMADIINSLPDKAKNSGLFYLFTKSAGQEVPASEKVYKNISPNKLLTMYKRLPSELKDAFFGSEGKGAMKFYEQMASINADAMGELKSIRTGEQTAKSIAKLTQLGAMAGDPAAGLAVGASAFLPGYLRSKSAKQAFLTGRGAFKIPEVTTKSGLAGLREILGDNQ